MNNKSKEINIKDSLVVCREEDEDVLDVPKSQDAESIIDIQYQKSLDNHAEIEKISLNNLTQEQLLRWFGMENIHNGSHFMSPTDNDIYQELCSLDLKEAIKFLRDKWGEYVDRDFIQSFALVHWVVNSEQGLIGLESLISKISNEVEISTQAYHDDESLKQNPRWRKARFGLLIEGKVNLASNEDIQTNQWRCPNEEGIVKRRKYTEWANRLMTNETNCVSAYEFVVGDWKVVGVVIEPDTPDIDKVIAIANKYNLPIVDVQNNNLFKSRV